MNDLLERAAGIARTLTQHGETVAVAESSTGGLISAALVAQPGASAFFRGGGVIYTREARLATLGLDDAAMSGMRSATEPYAVRIAGIIQERHGSTWGLGESGASGPTGNRYGDAAGHACLAVVGPATFWGPGEAGSVGPKKASIMLLTEEVRTVESGHGDRERNMRFFAATLLDMFAELLGKRFRA